MTATAQAGALLGAVAAMGALLAISRMPLLRRPRLIDRVADYVRPSAGPTWGEARTVTPFPLLERLLSPQLRAGAAWLERVIGGGDAVARRLSSSGSTQSVEQYRVEQLLLGCLGLTLGLGLGALALSRGSVRSPVVVLGLALVLALGGVLLRDVMLTRTIRQREERMLAEFPTIADLLALSVAAGEGPLPALQRVASISDGVLAQELRRSLAEANSGASLVTALDATAARSSLPALARFVDGIAVSLERGTPLADVLRAQAGDVRDLRKRALMETGGRKEILMLVPVVFLILPVTVLFALFPGIAQFQTIVG